jgi:hypothetical protein
MTDAVIVILESDRSGTKNNRCSIFAIAGDVLKNIPEITIVRVDGHYILWYSNKANTI